MQLPGALFDQIALTLTGGATASAVAAEPSAGQRRREPRVAVNAPVTVIPLTDALAAAPFDVTVRDLSPGGVRFVHDERIGLDQQFVVLLPGGRESAAVLCQVAYYQPLGEREFAVGAKFVRVLRQPAPHDGSHDGHAFSAQRSPVRPHPAA
jgi:hypothetical protein